MGLIKQLVLELASEMGNKQSHQSYNPAYGGPQPSQYSVAPQQRHLPMSGYQTKYERKAERRLARADAKAESRIYRAEAKLENRIARAEAKVERAAMRADATRIRGCCGSRRMYTPPTQLGVASYGPSRQYVDAPREFRDVPRSGYTGKDTRYNSASMEREHQPQQTGYEMTPKDDEENPPPAYEDVVRRS